MGSADMKTGTPKILESLPEFWELMLARLTSAEPSGKDGPDFSPVCAYELDNRKC